MSNTLSMQRPPRVLFLGMQGNFSPPSLHALLDNGIEVSAVAVPASQPSWPGIPTIRRREQPRTSRPILPLLHASVLQLAWAHHIPLWEVQRISDSQVISVLASYHPDIICVSCFSQRIPRAILDLPRLGCLNVHPSLLPANRGPVPFFWTFREGYEQTGVTIHLMDEAMDSGAILAQEPIKVPDGISYAQLESHCALRGGELLAHTVWNLYRGCVVPLPQDETKSSYHPFPSAQDFVVNPAEWNARHVYNFLCGVGHWSEPIKLFVNGEYVVVQQAISYSQESRDDIPGRSSNELWVQCKVGWVKVRNPRP